jgi:hypothetical protein
MNAHTSRVSSQSTGTFWSISRRNALLVTTFDGARPLVAVDEDKTANEDGNTDEDEETEDLLRLLSPDGVVFGGTCFLLLPVELLVARGTMSSSSAGNGW